MGRTVLLLHQLPDGSSHFDWLIERPDAERLLSFRVRERIDDPATPGYRRFEAEPMPDHRREYLQYEGPVSGGRGKVLRVSAGRVDVVSISADAIVLVLVLGSAERRRLEGAPIGDGGAGGGSGGPGRWVFTATPLEPSPAAR